MARFSLSPAVELGRGRLFVGAGLRAARAADRAFFFPAALVCAAGAAARTDGVASRASRLKPDSDRVARVSLDLRSAERAATSAFLFWSRLHVHGVVPPERGGRAASSPTPSAETFLDGVAVGEVGDWAAVGGRAAVAVGIAVVDCRAGDGGDSGAGVFAAVVGRAKARDDGGEGLGKVMGYVGEVIEFQNQERAASVDAVKLQRLKAAGWAVWSCPRRLCTAVDA
ncbi:hypothetical protein ON010_g10886 [Phytophthora cinnamomi]|nr:hypothetical protein ON010_g10886 [Phytophthora cinnamomi]